MGINIKESTGNFFDRKSVINAIGKARSRIFNEFGRRVRKTAQTSIKYDTSPRDDKSSAPGEPPLGHKSRRLTKTSKTTGKTRTRRVSFLREWIWYKYDKMTKSVVIGPQRLDTTAHPESLPTLEYGGTASSKKRTIFKKRAVGRDKRTGRFSSQGVDRVEVGGTFRIQARPFMRPAYEKERPGLMNLWKDSL